MICGIIKVEVSVRLQLITLTELRSHSYFAVHELDIAVRALDIALGNHALRAQPTDYSLICRLRCFPELTVGLKPMRRQMVTTMYNNRINTVYQLGSNVKELVILYSLVFQLFASTKKENSNNF